MQQEIKLKDLSIQELESIAYRLIVQREDANRNLIAVEQELVNKIAEKSKETEINNL